MEWLRATCLALGAAAACSGCTHHSDEGGLRSMTPTAAVRSIVNDLRDSGLRAAGPVEVRWTTTTLATWARADHDGLGPAQDGSTRLLVVELRSPTEMTCTGCFSSYLTDRPPHGRLLIRALPLPMVDRMTGAQTAMGDAHLPDLESLGGQVYISPTGVRAGSGG